MLIARFTDVKIMITGHAGETFLLQTGQGNGQEFNATVQPNFQAGDVKPRDETRWATLTWTMDPCTGIRVNAGFSTFMDDSLRTGLNDGIAEATDQVKLSSI